VESQSRVQKMMMTVIVAALSVAAVAAWSTWSVTDVAAAPAAPAATEALSPAEPATPSATASQPAAARDGAAVVTAVPQTTTGTADVALTFDDGPDPVNTPKILDLLKRNQVRATFCVVGTRAQAYPDLIRRIVAEGHTLCNHSWQHRLDLGTRSPAEIDADLVQTDAAIHAAAPDAPIRFFRAPGGNFTPALARSARALGMTPLLWQVDPRDWDSTTFGTGAPLAAHVVSAVRAAVRPGSIVLSHDSGHPDTVDAYAQLLPALKSRFTLTAL
jgi:peptidoglycan/xylan/chitin deacetylase (PgdA/CDA1 family)